MWGPGDAESQSKQGAGLGERRFQSLPHSLSRFTSTRSVCARFLSANGVCSARFFDSKDVRSARFAPQARQWRVSVAPKTSRVRLMWLVPHSACAAGNSTARLAGRLRPLHVKVVFHQTQLRPPRLVRRSASTWKRGECEIVVKLPNEPNLRQNYETAEVVVWQGLSWRTGFCSCDILAWRTKPFIRPVGARMPLPRG